MVVLISITLQINFESKTKHNDHSGGNNGLHPTHAYVHWAATELLAVFAPAFPLSLLRQEIRPQTAQAHSLGRYGSV